MPDYKHRRIELTPRRHSDGNWSCQYVIIEFRQTSWGYRQGLPDGIFASRADATAVALEEAKCIVDSFEPTSVFGTYADRLGRLILSLSFKACAWVNPVRIQAGIHAKGKCSVEAGGLNSNSRKDLSSHHTPGSRSGACFQI